MNVSGVILAAGYSTRLSSILKGKPKQLVLINNIPLIYYPILNMIHQNIDDILIVVNNENYHYIERVVKPLTEIINIDFIVNEEPERENGLSFILGIESSKHNTVVISMSDHIHVSDIIRKMIEAHKNMQTSLIVGGDSKPKYIDIREATKILAPNKQLINIGKELEKWTHIDIGLFIANKNLLNKLSTIEKEYYKITISKIIKKLSKEDNILVVDIEGIEWTEIDTPKDLEEVTRGTRTIVPIKAQENYNKELLRTIRQELQKLQNWLINPPHT